MPKGDRVPIEEQKRRKAEYQRNRIAKMKADGTYKSQYKKKSKSEIKASRNEQSRKRKAWMQTPEGRAHMQKLWDSSRKHESKEERDRYWSKSWNDKTKKDLVACLTERMRQCKYRAKKKGLPFDIDVEYLKSIYQETCPYLGIRLVLGKQGKSQRDSLSIDRIEPSRGYVKGNVMVVSSLANKMKHDASLDELKVFAKSVLSLHGQAGNAEHF